jgi:hypothetical protein
MSLLICQLLAKRDESWNGRISSFFGKVKSTGDTTYMPFPTIDMRRLLLEA